MSVTLEHIDDFRQVLKDYSPSEEALQLLHDTPLVILLGVTGSGRNTIINHLLKTGKYHFIVSDTTRSPKFRDGKMEENGVQYYFRSEADVLEDLRNGLFLEAEVIHQQQVSGISIRGLIKARESGKIPINEVDVEGTVNILKAKPDTRMFFIVPPSYREWLHRLDRREEMSKEELSNRIRTAINVINTGLANDHFSFVINEFSHESADYIDEEVHKNVRNQQHDRETREIARQILREIEQHHSIE